MEIAIALGAAVAGLIVGYFIRKVQISNQVNSIEARVSRALDEAKSKEKDIAKKTKSEFIKICRLFVFPPIFNVF